jgi:hypothetical protein
MPGRANRAMTGRAYTRERRRRRGPQAARAVEPTHVVVGEDDLRGAGCVGRPGQAVTNSADSRRVGNTGAVIEIVTRRSTPRRLSDANPSRAERVVLD